MDDLRMGRAVLVLRRRKGLTQVELARRAGLSASTVSRIERGLVAGLTLRVLRTVAEPLGMRIELRARWRGGDIDRLLDAAHAGLVEACLRILRHMGWSVIPEASFSIYGERGSVDVLAWHPARGLAHRGGQVTHRRRAGASFRAGSQAAAGPTDRC